MALCKPNLKNKKAAQPRTNGFVKRFLHWQGQKDLNPRHSVLEWLFNDKKLVKIRLFKPFGAAFLIRPSAFDALLMI